MRIFANVKPRARVDKIEQVDATHYLVDVKAPPVDGKANQAVIKLLAAELHVPFARIVLISGGNGRSKVFEVY